MELLLGAVVVAVLIICALTVRAVRRDGYGQRAIKPDYDSRRPEL